jgi:integrase
MARSRRPDLSYRVTEFGRPVNVNSLVYKHFKPILKSAGLPNIRLYDLRHTAATLALTVGVSPKVMSEQLGHTQLQRSH